MTLGIVILAHRSPEQLGRMMGLLAHPRVRLYLHVDARTDRAPFERASRSSGAAVTLLTPRPSGWGGPEVVDASLDGIRSAVADGCGYVLQISGQDWPVWPVERTVGFFARAGTASWMSHFPLPDAHWRLGGRFRTDFWSYWVGGRRETHVPAGEDVPMSWKGRLLNLALGLRSLPRGRRRFPACARPYGGSSWWNLSRVAAEHVLEFVARHPEYRAYHEHSLCPDEFFFQSILLGTDFALGHEVIDDPLRFMRWQEGASHPDVLTLADLDEIVEADLPFARKVDAGVDARLLDRLPVA